MAGRELPQPEHYNGYEQLEDGIGMTTFFLQNTKHSLEGLNINAVSKIVSVITGVSSYKYIDSVCKEIEGRVNGLIIKVYPIINNFFGEKITVTGLLTGKDILEQLKGKEIGEVLLMPSNLLKSGEKVLLDDFTVEEMERILGIDIRICSFDGSDFLETIIG
jgi:NifB/MoaA-like Fe-S oxidoreductase